MNQREVSIIFISVKIGDLIYIDEKEQSPVLYVSLNGTCQVHTNGVGTYWISPELILQYNPSLISKWRSSKLEELGI